MPIYYGCYAYFAVAWVVQSDGVVREPNEDEMDEFFERELDNLACEKEYV